MTHITPDNILIPLNAAVVNLELREEWHLSSKDQRFM